MQKPRPKEAEWRCWNLSWNQVSAWPGYPCTLVPMGPLHSCPEGSQSHTSHMDDKSLPRHQTRAAWRSLSSHVLTAGRVRSCVIMLDEERLRPTFPGWPCKMRNSSKLPCPSTDRISLLLIKGYWPELLLIINESR